MAVPRHIWIAVNFYVTICACVIILFAAGCEPFSSTPEYYNVNISVQPIEGGRVSKGSGQYDAMSNVEFEAIPNEGWRFDEWQGDISSRRNPLKIMVEKDTELIALFKPKGKLYWIAPRTGGYGTTGPSMIRSATIDKSISNSAVVEIGYGGYDYHSIDVNYSDGSIYWIYDVDKSIYKFYNYEIYEILTSEHIAGLHSLVVDSTDSMIYYSEGQGTYRSKLSDPSGTKEAVNGMQAYSLDIDVERDIIYGYGASNERSGDMEIWRSNVDGSGMEDLIYYENETRYDVEIEVDPVDQKMYWTKYEDGVGYIMRSNTDGSNVEVVAHDDNIISIDIDHIHRNIYWSNTLSIIRADLDGSNKEVFSDANAISIALSLAR